METAIIVLDVLRRVLPRLFRAAGPYLAVEILLPGGTLIALALYLYRQRKTFFGRAVDFAFARSTSNVKSN